MSQLREATSFHHNIIYSTSQISEDEISFLTEGDNPNDDDVVLKKLFHPNLSLLLVSEGKAGCRYYTKVCSIFACSQSNCVI